MFQASVGGRTIFLTDTQLRALTRSGTPWVLGGQTLSATSSIGSTSAHGVNLTTNGTARVYFDASGRFVSGTLTDINLTASDSVVITSAGPSLQLVSGFARLKDSGGTVRYQMNNSTGATAITLPDNTSTAANVTISGGADMLVFNTTDGAEVVTLGSTAAASSATLQGDTIVNIKSDRVRILGNTGGGAPVVEVGEAVANGTNYIGVVSPASLSTNYTQTLTAATGTIPVALLGSATLDFPSVGAGTSSDLTVTVTGAVDGDVVSIGVPNGSTAANGCFTAWVSASNTVTIRFTNTNTVAAIDPASGTFKVKVFP